jgi:plastocyanin
MQTYFRSLLVAALVAGLALVGCGKDDKGDRAQPTSSSSSAQGSVPLSGEAPVRIINFEFKPQTIVVKPGTKVTWTNEDTSIHDIKDTSPLGIPQSKDLSKGDTFSATYSQPGTYTYICGIHQYMTGSVQVVS